MVGKPITKRMYEIAFLCGQPLGYYGSWSLFSLSHHYIVWLAAKKAYPHLNRPFKDYALLGDDILITDKQVALQYRKLLDRLGVTISDAKSIVSDTGAVEFAKKFWVKSMQIDLSPISLSGCVYIANLRMCDLVCGVRYSSQFYVVIVVRECIVHSAPIEDAYVALDQGKVMEDLQIEMMVLRHIVVVSGQSHAGSSKVKIPEPKPFGGARSAKELKYFLWDME
ncbi:hypothetical protein T459_01625 [Capsicum annuum]|uniref:Reverse transcriptase domain-containing protein n=1 Tax=Capsicum annuum TaxID=4072 RepID=A0A2G3AHV4_CAPAN|nr:hypothetical protein T459_01625 [Capsicum annuum]